MGLGLRFRVLGFRILGCRDYGGSFVVRAYDLEFAVWGLGFGVWTLDSQTSSHTKEAWSGFRVIRD